MAVLTRGQAQSAADLPPRVRFTMTSTDGKASKAMAVAVGMNVDVLRKNLAHLFSKELKELLKSAAFEIIGVKMGVGLEQEHIPLDVLALKPAIVIVDGESQDVELELQYERPKDKEPLQYLYTFVLAVLCLTALYLARSCLFRPFLRELYRSGPAYNFGVVTIGFWEGAHLATICSLLTGIADTSFWEQNQRQCVAIFAQKEEAFLFAAEVITLALLYYKFRAEIKSSLLALPGAVWEFASFLVKLRPRPRPREVSH
mmetsp:Transcript_20625/g.52351  ORF Transcript_20625/g.52351 Transcript_20625/m.52351 type:complete len:258 (-) Transcript_20625:1486-2259(-)